ncbi:MAG: flagellar P-ring protein [Gammaproteobacteria bacterium]|nr:MAG: flagellar basal body P-ring protein FlgI [Pseudomonadota bacterium]MBC6944224.1 flagellar basal body P-ring protein FlgI [Gammaproteobacteria bacterium]MCE7895816.1 flagellar basal body P-ring protein FlgI [Gammaproteobacteria bacterium PRO8]MDL1879519.1 flagellar basal body P-ring protein FlgI [Gammaproteobacteria bacterium PRO2]MCL4777556.1 flagellar basal body P-ring protein FlgI [Gammaproteobacteria bacterium]
MNPRHNARLVQTTWLLAGMMLLLMQLGAEARAERIKDVATVAGVRNNQLIGYGLVVGLDGTGDQTTQAPFTTQSLISMLERLGVTLPPGSNLQLKNIAAVAVSADLPPFAKPGQTIDITVSSIANAKSLRGGTLLVTPLKGMDGQIYAIAQGNLAVSGLGISGQDGSKISINVPSVGTIPNGATVERAVPTQFAGTDHLLLNLNQPDFTTATHLADSINRLLGAGTALPLDPTSIRVAAPQDAAARISFLSAIENLDVTPGDAPAKVIVNSRTGTVVINSQVRVTPAAVSHGSLVVSITEDFNVSQPQPFAEQGQTVVTPQSNIDVSQGNNHMFLFKAGVDLNDIVRAVNEVGAAPGDLVAILQALRAAGALRAELLVI